MSFKSLLVAAALLAAVPSVHATSTGPAADPTENSWKNPHQRSFIQQGLVKMEVVTGTPESGWTALPFRLSHGRAGATLSSHQTPKLRLTNESEGRVMLILSVNGINPYTGRKAYQGEKGQVLEPGATLLVEEGKISRKAEWSPILPANQEKGTVAVAVFHERTDYPLTLPNTTSPPFGPETFRTGADGVLRWVPPKGYPFRRVEEYPTALLQMDYQLATSSALAVNLQQR